VSARSITLLELNNKLSEDFDHIVSEYTKLNDKTYNEVSELIITNSKKLEELDSKMKVEWTTTVKNFDKNITSFKKELSEKLDNLNDASKKRTSKIKDICTHFFNKHEERVDDIQAKVSGVTQAFDEWKIYVMNPQSINEARIHSIDVKWDDIEQSNTNNFGIVYNIIKKLLFSLQQQVLTQSNTFTIDNLDEDQSIRSRDVNDKPADGGMSNY